MKLTTIGIDLAKNVFQVHGVDEMGKAVMQKPLKRAQLLPFFVNSTPCRIGMEASGSAHNWVRNQTAYFFPTQYHRQSSGYRASGLVQRCVAELQVGLPKRHHE